MVYVAVATLLFVSPLNVAKALITVLLLTVIDQVYCVELVLGLDPSVV